MLQKILYTTILVNPGLDGPATHAAVTVTACFAVECAFNAESSLEVET
jgi:hypothetical protein